jgi:hypothetical protein
LGTYIVAIKSIWGWWRNYEVTSHSFDGKFFELSLLSGDSLILPYKGRPFKLKSGQRRIIQQPQQAQPLAKEPTFSAAELKKLRDELKMEQDMAQWFRSELSAQQAEVSRPSPSEERQAIIARSAQARVNEMLGRDADAEIGSGRVLQGGSIQPEGYSQPY